MTPPQVRPTENASSSLTPYRCRTAASVCRDCSASSYTAPSTQPPDTLPTAVPSGPTSIVAPAWRGALRQVPTTVARPTGSPARHHASSSSTTSRTAHLPDDFLQCREAVPGDQRV